MVMFWRVWSCENWMVLAVCFSMVDGLKFWDGYWMNNCIGNVYDEYVYKRDGEGCILV